MSKSKQDPRRPDMRFVAGMMLVCALAACKKDNTAEQATPAAGQQAATAAPPPVAVSAEVAAEACATGAVAA